jgi:large subunit ribosomal protein L5
MSTNLKIKSTENYEKARLELGKQEKLHSFATPKIEKISINVGVGDYKNDAKARADIEKYLVQLTGQKPKLVASRLSISGFKLRKGEPVGMVVTLRGRRMYDFLTNLVFLALPRTRDFRGITDTSFDKKYKSYSLGISSSSIFPTIGFDSTINFGMQINIVFTTTSPKNLELLKKLNFPFKK